jgi:hypothetical protein
MGTGEEPMNEFSETVFDQFEQVRDDGMCNMFNRFCVQEVADTFGFDELADVADDKRRYPKLLSAFSDWKAGR